MDWGFEVGKHKLLHLELISNEILLYSTGNYIQYLVVTYHGKEYEKQCMYICITESLCSKNLTHYKLTILQLKKFLDKIF